MPEKKMKHPIKSSAQRRFFGSELSKLNKGQSTISGMSSAVLNEHLKASAGKKLPEKVKKHKK